ncbi:hypothetical protein D8B24_16685 [Verminephrobacter aporrectodeae subsp. tuberculatae]|uniref:SwmB domain-containing protein n=1 Tax=Verminephrobacter aporrectodeae TaxID=1110389 RepID=UPI002243FDAB|nr:SwmB domain-containing protein [Verminephrobacter aporrectodeae]MCW8208620.1 hypothetical protein [Verminephrobacter aporrectodeae subsp. tuberculatae]
MSRLTDSSGNKGNSRAVSGIRYDINTTVSRTRPGASIALADTSLPVGESTPVTIPFSALGPLTANAEGKNQAVANNSAADTTAPVLSTATVSGRDLVLSYTEANGLGLDAAHPAPVAAFAVSSNSGVAIAVESVTVHATAKTVTLRLTRPVDSGEAVNLSYTKPMIGNNVLQDAAGNDAGDLANQPVTNNSAADTTAPVLGTATVSGRDLVLSYTEASGLGLDATHPAPVAAFAVSSSRGVAIAVESVTVNATAKTVTLRLTRSVDSGEAVTLSYTKPAAGNNALQDAVGNDASNLTNQAVTNNQRTASLDASHTAPAAALVLSNAAGTAITVTDAVVNATAKTATLTLSRAVTRGGADHQLLTARRYRHLGEPGE